MVFFAISILTFAAGHVASVSSSANVSCYGSSDGQATIAVTGGVGPFTYSWLGLPPISNNVLTGLSAGTYNVTVTDTDDMSTTTTSFTITQPQVLTLTIPSFYAVCNGSCVTLSPTVIGGTSGYTYSWTPSTGLNNSIIGNPISCPATTTTYTIIATDANGCVATATTTVSVSTISANMSVTNVSVCGACDGSGTVTVTGGSGPYAYNWLPGGITTQVYMGTCAGDYVVVVTDMMGCTATDSATIYSTSINANFSMVPDSTNAYSYWAYNTTAGSGMSYFWDFGDGTTSNLTSPTHLYTAPGTYSVCLTAASALCNTTSCTNVVVSGVSNPCNALFNIATDTNSLNPNAFTVYNLSYGSNLTYLWNFGDGNTSTQANPTHIYSSNGNYQLCLTVDNGAGCTQTYCDSLLGVDSLSRTNSLSLTVVNGPDFPSVVTGIDVFILNSSITVYPNPFTEFTTFSINTFKSNEIYSFELYDVLGKKVKSIASISAKQFEITRNGLENGVYFYKIISSESTVNTGKLILK